jgi:hypothetical protein
MNASALKAGSGGLTFKANSRGSTPALGAPFIELRLTVANAAYVLVLGAGFGYLPIFERLARDRLVFAAEITSGGFGIVDRIRLRGLHHSLARITAGNRRGC